MTDAGPKANRAATSGGDSQNLPEQPSTAAAGAGPAPAGQSGSTDHSPQSLAGGSASSNAPAPTNAKAAGDQNAAAKATSPPPSAAAVPLRRPGGEVLSGAFGRYRITKYLGESRFGEVYLAVDSEQGQTVVLKTARFSAEDESGMAAFHRVAKLVAQVKHRNVCPVLNDGVIENTHFYARAFVEGQPLSDFMCPEKPPPPRQVTMLVRKIASALVEVHRRGFIHGDLKPANVLIDMQREPNLTDFAFRPEVWQRDVESGSTPGADDSRDYDAPEKTQEKLGAVGPATDVYQLGVILYELLTSTRPFRGSPEDVAREVTNNDPELPSKRRPGLHPSLDLICLKLLTRQPQRRYVTMEQVVVALDDYLEGGSSSSTHTGDAGELAMMADFYRACTTFDARDAEVERHRQRIKDLLEDHKYSAAEQLLSRITKFQDPALSDFVDWAKKQLPIVRALPEKHRRESIAAYRVASEMVEHYEYDQAAALLRKIPPKYLTDHSAELLQYAVRCQEEVDLLSSGLEAAEAASRLKNMLPQVERLLELKPNDSRALRVRRELRSAGHRAPASQTIRSPRRRRKRKNWPLLTAVGLVAAVIVGMAILLASKIDFKHGTIAVNIDNPRSTIIIDGTRLAANEVGLPIQLERGSHSLVVIRDDGKRFTQDFEVKWGRNRPLLIEVGGAGDYGAAVGNGAK